MCILSTLTMRWEQETGESEIQGPTRLGYPAQQQKPERPCLKNKVEAEN